jgi:hypothetical protein
LRLKAGWKLSLQKPSLWGKVFQGAIPNSTLLRLKAGWNLSLRAEGI